ncbi:MAG: amidohydrolase family protein [Candidatus Hydrogenedentes bacterium]|nr:amidohydrolase family protein [Candidatus Hydrogenedentota bacterium]
MRQSASERDPYTLTRRGFLGATAAIAVGLTARGEDPEETAAMAAGPFFDIHTHLGQKWGNRPPLDPEGLLRWMDSRNVAQAAVLPLISPESWDHVLTPDYVLSQTEPYRDRLIPFCSIDPRTLNLNGYQPKLDLLLRYKEAGAKGFGEHKCGIAMDDPRNLEIYAACAEAKLPVLFHMDNQRNMDQPGLPGLTKVLEQVPEGVFIGHANGWWAAISGDCTQEDMGSYPNRPVTPGGAMDALMDRFPNIYADLSAGSGANAIMRDMTFGREFVIRRADRLLFGTDYLAPGQKVVQFSLYGEMELPEDVKVKVFRDNARALLGLQ